MATKPVAPPKKSAPPKPAAETPPPTEQAPKPDYVYEDIEELSDTTLAQELSSLSLEDYRSLKEAALALANQKDLPEAGGIAFTEFSTKGGGIINVTSRAQDSTAALNGLVRTIAHANASWGMTLRHYSGTPAASAKQSKTSAPRGEDGSSAAESGTDVLREIVVDPGKNVEFHVGKFKWPFKDARITLEGGPQIIADLFDKELGWTPDHFAEFSKYTPEDWGGTLYVDWAKEPGAKGVLYYNVKRVHA